MSEMILSAVIRSDEKHSARAARQSGLVPAVFYEKGNKALSIAVNKKAIRPFIYTAERNIIDLKVEGDNTVRKCVVKDFQIHPVSEELLHVDLLGVSEDAAITVEVPVKFVGQAIGVREGGLFQPLVHSLKVTAKPQFLPSHIDVNIADLKLGESILIKDIKIENVKFNEVETVAVASVVTPRVAADTEASAIAEPEVVGKKGKKEDA